MNDLFYDISLIILFISILVIIFSNIKIIPILACFFAGVIIGPWGLKIIDNEIFIEKLILFLLPFLLFFSGLLLKPKIFFKWFKKTFLISIITIFITIIFVLLFNSFFNLEFKRFILISFFLSFSSLIFFSKFSENEIESNIYEISISILFMHVILGIFILMSLGTYYNNIDDILFLLVRGLSFILSSFFIEHYFIRKILDRYYEDKEIFFIIVLGWFFGLSLLSKEIGFPYEVGALIAGITLSRTNISNIIYYDYKYIRYIALSLFLFALGAKFDFLISEVYINYILMIFFIIFIIKPIICYMILKYCDIDKKDSKMISLLSINTSELTLVFSYLALEMKIINIQTQQILELMFIITVVLSLFLSGYINKINSLIEYKE